MNKFDQLCNLLKHYSKSETGRTKEIIDKILHESKNLKTKRRHGIYEQGDYKGSTNGTSSPEKLVWEHMITRCTPGPLWKIRPSYEGCSCSELFQNFQTFADWCNKQIGFGRKGWALDKDLLVKGNKIYSENTCVFLPQALNSLFTKRESLRGNYPIGVTSRNNGKTFISQCHVDGKLKQVHGFKDVESAFLKYKEMKEYVIKQQAEKWKDQIDPRAYNALINYQVEITD